VSIITMNMFMTPPLIANFMSASAAVSLHVPFAVDVALCDAELSMRVGPTSAAAAGGAACDEALWSPWLLSFALESHIKSIRRSLCVAVSAAAVMDIHA
jgi:hypothetical protein